MPMFGMDPMGNYTGLDWTDTEEELRRQEEERRRLEAEKPVKQTVTINPDGTQDVTIKGSASTLQNMVADKRAASVAPVAPQNVSALGITPFVGVGHDFGGSTVGSDYTYGLVGATTGAKIGPGFALAGVKTRVGSDEKTQTKQTVTFVSYAVPVAKDVAVNVGLSRSAQDIKERGASVGVSFGF